MADQARISWLLLAEGLLTGAPDHTVMPPSWFGGHLTTAYEACCPGGGHHRSHNLGVEPYPSNSCMVRSQ